MSLKEKILSSYMAFEDFLADDSPLHDMRSDAIKQFETQGFPDKKQEDWKYTSLKRLLKEDYAFATKKENTIEFKDVKQYFLHDLDTYKVVFVDGAVSYTHLTLPTTSRV